MREVRIVCDLPKKSIGVGEMAGVTASVGRVPGLHHFCAMISGMRKQRIHLRRRAHVMRERKPGKS